MRYLDSSINRAIVVKNDQGKVVYLSEVQVRNDIATTMKARTVFRQNRRRRKTRYRKAHWLNRKNSIKQGRFSPTMRSKIEAHLREIRFVRSLLPIQSIVLETGTFDPHALKNTEVFQKKWLYQKGINYGFANTKAYVLTRDGYKERCILFKKIHIMCWIIRECSSYNFLPMASVTETVKYNNGRIVLMNTFLNMRNPYREIMFPIIFTVFEMLFTGIIRIDPMPGRF